VLQVFLTLSADDLKEIGIKLFGPRRKMTNAIESWHKEHGTNANNLNGGELVEQLQSELREKNWQLSQVCLEERYLPRSMNDLVQ